MTKNFSISSVYSFYFMMALILPFSFLLRVFYSQTITPEDFGLIYSIIAFYGILSLFVTLGLDSSFEYFIGKYRTYPKGEKNISQIFQVTLIIKSVLIFISVCLIYLFSNYLAQNYFKSQVAQEIIIIFIFYFVFLKLYSTFRSVFVAYQMNIYFQAARLVELISILTISIIFFLLIEKNMLIYYSYAWGIGNFISFAIFLFILIYKFPFLFKIQKYEFSVIESFIIYGFKMFSVGIGSNIISKTDIIIVTYFASLSFVAFYSNAIAIISVTAGTIALLSRVLMPLFAYHNEKKEYGFLKKIVSILYTNIIFFLLPFCAILFLYSEIIVRTIFGSEYTQGAIVLSLLSIFMIFKTLNSFNMSFLNGLGMAKDISYIIYPISIFNLVGNIILVQLYSINGVAIITGVSWLLIFILTTCKLKKQLKLQFNYIYYIKVFISLVCFIFSLYILKSIIQIINIYFSGIIILSITLTGYILLGYLLKIFTIEELYIFIPNKYKSTIKKYHQTYFKFLK